MRSLTIFTVGLITLVGVAFGTFWSLVAFCGLFIFSLCYDVYERYRVDKDYANLLMERENERTIEQFNKPDEEYLKDINL